jgi:hypothetical protein
MDKVYRFRDPQGLGYGWTIRVFDQAGARFFFLYSETPTTVLQTT